MKLFWAQTTRTAYRGSTYFDSDGIRCQTYWTKLQVGASVTPSSRRRFLAFHGLLHLFKASTAVRRTFIALCGERAGQWRASQVVGHNSISMILYRPSKAQRTRKHAQNLFCISTDVVLWFTWAFAKNPTRRSSTNFLQVQRNDELVNPLFSIYNITFFFILQHNNALFQETETYIYILLINRIFLNLRNLSETWMETCPVWLIRCLFFWICLIVSVDSILFVTYWNIWTLIKVILGTYLFQLFPMANLQN